MVDDLSDIYISRNEEDNELMYDNDYMQTMLDGLKRFMMVVVM